MSRNRSPRGGGRSDLHHSRRDAGPSQRQLRVGEMLRHALAEILNRNEIRDPDLDGISVTITQIKPSPDMAQRRRAMLSDRPAKRADSGAVQSRARYSPKNTSETTDRKSVV